MRINHTKRDWLYSFVVYGICVLCLVVTISACKNSPDLKSKNLVHESVDIGAKWKCADPRACDEDYLQTAEDQAAHADREVVEDFANIESIRETQPPIDNDHLSDSALREKIINTLNLSFLLNGMDDRILEARTVHEIDAGAYLKKRILLSDPLIGEFEILFFTPKTAGPHPAVIAAHGHGESADLFVSEFGLKQFPEKGYALAAPTFRVMGADASEDRLVRELMRRGFTLMSIRIYEILLIRKYLLSKDEIIGSRIGLLGHSGGSIAGNLVVRIDNGFAAYVGDCKGSYLGVYEDKYLLDEFAPRLFTIHRQINDLTTTKTPTKKIPYAKDKHWDSVFEFFDRFLKKT